MCTSWSIIILSVFYFRKTVWIYFCLIINYDEMSISRWIISLYMFYFRYAVFIYFCLIINYDEMSKSRWIISLYVFYFRKAVWIYFCLIINYDWYVCILVNYYSKRVLNRGGSLHIFILQACRRGSSLFIRQTGLRKLRLCQSTHTCAPLRAPNRT